MKTNDLFLGIDTSNYTTSVALADNDGNILANIKRLLPVKSGERGLRQSDAVFLHTKALPELSEVLSEKLCEIRRENPSSRISAVGYSKSPRDSEGSYMPCFLCGESVASITAASCGARLYSSSHQAGHIMAALYSAGAISLLSGRFVAFHVSGGTTDILMCEPDETDILKITKIGGTLDINAGQAIDRAGVMLGLSFPAGAELEKIAISYEGVRTKPKVCVHEIECNLSGVENKAKEMFSLSGSKEETAAYVFDFVGETLDKLTENLRIKYGEIPIVYAGGVMSSSIFKKRLSKYSEYFAEPLFSSDNAAGTALICREKFLRGK